MLKVGVWFASVWFNGARSQWDKIEKPGQKSKNEIQILLFSVIALITRYATLIASEIIFLGIICFSDKC